MSLLEHADLIHSARHSTTAIDAEQFLLHALRCNCRCIDGHERRLLVARLGMNGAGDNFFARASGTIDQNSAAGRRNFAHRFAQLLDRLGFANDLDLPPCAQAKLRVLTSQPECLQAPFNTKQQTIRFERLLDEVICPELNGCNRGLDVAMPADHDHRHVHVTFFEQFEQRHAVEPAALQPNIEENRIRLTVLNLRKRTISIARHASFVALIDENSGYQRANVPLVINNQDVSCHRLGSCS